MKQICFCLIALCLFSCKKEANVIETDNNLTTSTVARAVTTTTTMTVSSSVNVKDQGAKGDGVTDDTKAIRAALLFAKSKGIPNIYFPDGSYMIGETGDGGGIIKLVDGVGMTGTGVATCHIKLTGNRYNPNTIFYQDYVNNPFIGNLIIQGIDFNGNLALQKYDASYQFGHALKIHNGSNIEVKNCKFQSFRGDGLLFGDVFEPTLNARMVKNVKVHDSEFFNIYREGTMFCCVNGASFYNNNVHGDGYLVAGVDIERHSVKESVLNVSVYNNTFNFNDGYGPVERGGPKVRYRRAVSVGFFYDGYTNAKVDSLGGHHKIYNNKIYQGQIDCWGIPNVSVTGNSITNTYENISSVQFITTPAIKVANAKEATGLINVNVDNNTINSAMGNGISFTNYNKAMANGNTISNTPLDALYLASTSGYFYGNIITNVGTASAAASGVLIYGNSSGLIVENNSVIDSRAGASRTTDFAVKVCSANNGAVAPKIKGNKGKNLLKGIISEYYYQLNYIIAQNNMAI